MDLLIDTQSLVWVSLGSSRLGPHAREAMTSGEATLLVSAVTAWEFADLNRRKRFGNDLPLGPLLDRLRARVIDYPAEAWRMADGLPDLHRDPVDRMLIAHAIHADMTLVTADEMIRRYPVRSLW